MRKKNQNSEEIKMEDILFTGFNIEEPKKIEEPKIEEPIEPAFKPYKVRVTHPSLRMRRAPSTQAEEVGLITNRGIYTIIDETNGWGKLENGNWIMLSYTEVTY